MANFAGGPIPFAGVPVAGPGGNGQGFVNVGLSQQLGSNLSQQSGINLAGGQNVLQSQLTPLLSAGNSNQLNDVVQNTIGSLGGANPLTSLLPAAGFLGGGGLMGGGGFGVGNILGGVGAGAGQLLAGAGAGVGSLLAGAGAGVGSLLSGLGGGLGGLLGGMGGGGANNKIWPGGGGNGPSDYGGFMHNLGQNGPDVVFSIVPANNGPQTAGLSSALSNPTVGTELPLKSYTTNVPNSAIPGFSAVSDFKYTASTFSGSGIVPGAVAGFPAGGR
jgi:hypothetical protein